MSISTLSKALAEQGVEHAIVVARSTAVAVKLPELKAWKPTTVRVGPEVCKGFKTNVLLDAGYEASVTYFCVQAEDGKFHVLVEFDSETGVPLVFGSDTFMSQVKYTLEGDELSGHIPTKGFKTIADAYAAAKRFHHNLDLDF